MHLKYILTPLIGFFLICLFTFPAASQTEASRGLASLSTPSNLESQEEDTNVEAATYSELSPEHNSAYVLSPISRTLQLLHRLPKYTTQALVYIMDISGRILKRILLDPKDQGGSKIDLSDLLDGSYQYVLTLDSGRKIQGSFELTD